MRPPASEWQERNNYKTRFYQVKIYYLKKNKMAETIKKDVTRGGQF
jgi:hypothetical protein